LIGGKCDERLRAQKSLVNNAINQAFRLDCLTVDFFSAETWTTTGLTTF